MDRYINADALIEKARHEAKGLDVKNFDILVEWLVDKTPLADVRENVRGEWIYGEDGIYCSRCKALVAETNLEYFCKHNFCPNCGADMRGEGE